MKSAYLLPLPSYKDEALLVKRQGSLPTSPFRVFRALSPLFKKISHVGISSIRVQDGFPHLFKLTRLLIVWCTLRSLISSIFGMQRLQHVFEGSKTITQKLKRLIMGWWSILASILPSFWYLLFYLRLMDGELEVFQALALPSTIEQATNYFAFLMFFLKTIRLFREYHFIFQPAAWIASGYMAGESCCVGRWWWSAKQWRQPWEQRDHENIEKAKRSSS